MNNIVEGFDSGDENFVEGAGEKLLHLLQRVSVENILVVVAMWYDGTADKINYSSIINVSRDLLTSLHNQAIEFEGEGEDAEGEGDEKMENRKVILRDNDQDQFNSLASSSHLGGINRGSKYFTARQNNQTKGSTRAGRKQGLPNLNDSKRSQRESATQPSVSENINSGYIGQIRSLKSPIFGIKHDIDNQQVIPRVFNFPEFNKPKFRLNLRPNSYFSALAESGNKFINPPKTKTSFSNFNEDLRVTRQLYHTSRRNRVASTTVGFNKSNLDSSHPTSLLESITQSINKTHIIDLQMMALDETIIKIFKALDIWNSLGLIPQLSLLKSKLFTLQPLKLDNDQISMLKSVIYDPNVISKAKQKGGIFKILVDYATI